MSSNSGTSAQTWWLMTPCDRTDSVPLDKACQIWRITDEFGQDTPHLQCVVHGNVVGHVVEPDLLPQDQTKETP